jgi:hypothetical protein
MADGDRYGERTRHRPGARLAAVARRQHGPLTRNQALGAGFSPPPIRRNVASGGGSSSTGTSTANRLPASLARDASAAALACGGAGAASHATAAALWDQSVSPPKVPEVVVLAPSRVRPRGVLVHVTGRLGPSEAAVRDGIRVTSTMRTLLDLAEILEPNLVELTLDRFWRRGFVDPRRLSTYLDDRWSRRRRGTAVLRGLVRARVGDRPSGADVETLLLQLIHDARLPPPARQHRVVTPFGVRYLDLAYPAPKIAIEKGRDGEPTRSGGVPRRARPADLIEAQGWTVRRFGYAHVTRDRLWTIFTLVDALEVRPVRWTKAEWATRRRK